MKKITYLIPAFLLSGAFLAPVANADSVLYSNSFQGFGYAANTLPAGTGLVDKSFIPPIQDCSYVLAFGNLSSGCVTDKTPAAGIPGNLQSYFESALFSLADPAVPTTPKVFTTDDSVITFDFKLRYFHNVFSPASVAQANYYDTDVNDYRLGWGFLFVTNHAASPVNVCLGITANKIVAYVDGLSQSSSSDTSDGYQFVSLYELANYSPLSLADVKIQIDKLHHKATYIINGVKRLTIDLAGQLPAPGTTVVSATVPVPGSGLNRVNASTSGLDGWTAGWVPVVSHLSYGSVGTANGRYSAGGLLDQQVVQTLFGQPQAIPGSYLRPFNSWANPGSYAFGTTYFMTLDSVNVTSQNSN